MTTIVLVRHAPTAWSGVRYCGRADPPLTDSGLALATDLAVALAPLLPEGVRIVSSPSRRARETATALALALAPTSIDVDERWQEVDVGLAEGRTFDELTVLEPDLATALAAGDGEIDWPGGETAQELSVRVRAAWASVLAAGRPTVVVSHGGALRVAGALATGRSPSEIEFLGTAAWQTYEVTAPGRPSR